MLQRLELVGFKSFAEKTRFDFAPGVTAIVGPNGSGKSNIVDAVRWILGEQSAKSLRGGEMADVIFNGSPSRKSLGLAEVTMTFDNSRNILNSTASEVQITRRVYRDGTGEYLINNQISRLKDIKELFLGSGAGSNAYSIIEQGRVDALLQASTADRRFIFEEAAGISRFKARKIETLRKLTHVEGNLQRLSDILAEVDKQLNKVRLEASKAQKYQEFTARLQELRVGSGLREYHRLTREWQSATLGLDELRQGLTDASREAVDGESQARHLEIALTEHEVRLRDAESALADARQRLVAGELTLQTESERTTEAERGLRDAGRRQLELGRQLLQLQVSRQQADAAIEAVKLDVSTRQEVANTLVESLESTTQQLAELRKQIDRDRAAHMDAVRAEANATNEANNLRRQTDDGRHQRDRLQRRLLQIENECDTLDETMVTLEQTGAGLQDQVQRTRHLLAEQTQRRAELRRQADALSQYVTEFHIDRGSLQSRLDLLHELERSQEGLGTGVREVLAWLGDDARARGLVIGLVGDLINVPREVAPLIELALGDRAASCFIVRNRLAFADLLAERDPPFASRVSFLELPQSGVEPPRDWPPLPNGAVRLAELVEVSDPSLRSLPEFLLGRTLLLPDWAAARQLAAEWGQRPGLRLLTRQGDLLESDGTLTVGRSHVETGLLSRKSELRELTAQISVLDARIRRGDENLAILRERVQAMEQPIRTMEQEIASLNQEAGDLSTQLTLRRTRRDDLDAEREMIQADLDQLDADVAERTEQIQHLHAATREAAQRVQVLQARMEQAEKAIRRLDQDRSRIEQDHTAAQVTLAQAREQLAAAMQHARQLDRDRDQKQSELAQVLQQRIDWQARLTESQVRALFAIGQRAKAFAEKDVNQQAYVYHVRKRDALRDERRVLLDRAQHARATQQDRVKEVHDRELRVQDLQRSRQLHIDRLREDYNLDLESLYAEQAEKLAVQADQPEDSTAVQEEIAELRKKLTRLGSVSLEALTELNEVEKRSQELRAQVTDLTQSKKSLMEIIERINDDSRRLFTEIFTSIRTHFQELFRKLFGGGQADIVLENPDDVLESGIEITARPPGKELRSISLMSGGEKTMTAIALLMAIFRNKPSPFCLLDEVDAALDEANTARLAGVIREFMDRSQFIVITHKKRTMSAADVLYGITMQESGVSKQVSVKFEDWPDEETGSPTTAQAA
ncbi:chromosome segregation protein SMC [Tuwongella immobilis]|uniref:Chromosome partition protein Smc n=1 Tax=Tuwongella immobilis TaxID=692036 RepID=A0A6C2YUW9_9BACT|nr:chromosome segregation protein SMC [Tuwongella immobilis]VIP05157.1 chromosome partition protein smc : Chromosome partition protein Smc OS=Blastopirellula marina DSM 3645 GN=smc PE=3 SV=1: SMC_N: SMC_hinge [Tuwongella immobilis]VTS07670.1 chromosome partition protein smc : Chromosome partition protein Smc OS=Blastopirellula marina DSM 3645 GN=smc PE=3 SV=1: SMC_N: SMC_hinge [Tuwongella immobilis]